MTVRIEGVLYFSASDVLRKLNVTRQTLWRWRRDGKIPPGLRYRDHKVLYTTREMSAIREYANRLEPTFKPMRSRSPRAARWPLQEEINKDGR